MNRFTQFLASSVLVLGISGCSEPESSFTTANQIREKIITAVNEALDQRKEGKSQSIAVSNDSNTCSITILDNPQKNKVVHIACYGTHTSVTTLLSIKGFGTIEKVDFRGGKFKTQSGCLHWNFPYLNGEIMKVNECAESTSA